MADGKTHDLHGLLLAALALGPALWLGGPALFLPAGVLLGTLFLSPDLDMWNTGPVKRWGPLRFLWAPYSALFKHRGLSHNPIVGPLSRLLYLLILAAPIYLLVSGLVPPPPASHLPLAYGAAGVVLANWLHLLAD